MNRRKKIKSILEKKDKKANARKNPSNKPRYISKADRANAQVADSNDNQATDAAAG